MKRFQLDPARVSIVLVIVGLVVVVAGLASGTGRAAKAGASAGALAPFRSCERVLGYAREHSDALVDGRGAGLEAGEMTAPAPPAADAAASGEEPGTESTNVQEEGVDEPDTVESNGETVFAIADGRLQAVRANDGSPTLAGTLELPTGPGSDGAASETELLLSGERLITISSVELERAPWMRTVVSEIDVSDPAAMRATETLSLDGAYVSARLTGETVRLVSSTAPGYPVPVDGAPVPTMPAPVERSSESGRRGWLPRTAVRDRAAGTVTHAPLVPCDQIRRPRRFSGLEMISVTTIDLARGLQPVDSDAVMSGGETVYASPTSLYVATERWHGVDPTSVEVESQVSTAIHRFDTADPDATGYVGSGTVPGYMLSQWSMSERDGLLRVASTTEPPWIDSGQIERSESFVTVLGQGAERLERVGRVGGLGAGESIYAVRFIDDVGYVVTFRQKDPLYTIDLSDPTRPAVLGELEVPGYSAYLHPTSDGRLLGIGQDADRDGTVTGAQASLFDVADLSAPVRLDQESLGSGTASEVETDHHAFTYWPQTGLAVIPLTDANGGGGAVAFRVTPEGTIDPLGGISHGPGWRAAISRSLVTGDRLYTVSERGLMASDLRTLAPLGFAEFRPGASAEPGPAPR